VSADAIFSVISPGRIAVERIDAPLDPDALAATVMERLEDRCGGVLPNSAEAAATLPW
jgi:hypothetical protein